MGIDDHKKKETTATSMHRDGLQNGIPDVIKNV
jgi:hypothetical protein